MPSDLHSADIDDLANRFFSGEGSVNTASQQYTLHQLGDTGSLYKGAYN